MVDDSQPRPPADLPHQLAELISAGRRDDAAIIGDLTLPTELIASIATPALVIDGEKSPPVMRKAARAVADALPNGRPRTLPNQTHDISPDATAAALEEFLST